MQEFLLSLSSNKRSLFSKCVENPVKFKNTIDDQFKEKVQEFSDIIIDVHSNQEKIYRISNNIYVTPKCICGQDLPFSSSGGVYRKFCTKKCSRTNVTPGKKEISVDNVTYDSLSSAIKETKLSRWNIFAKLFDNSAFWIKDNKIEIDNLKEKILSKHVKLRDVDFLISWKKEGKTANALAKELNVTCSNITTVYRIHGLDNTYDQMPIEIRNLLYIGDYLTNAIKTKSSEEIAKELKISPTSVLIALHSRNISWESKQYSRGEKEVVSFIKSILPTDTLILENKRNIIKFNKELDIYIPSMNIAIEYNGVFYHKDKPKIHQQKMQLCRDVGIRLIQIWDIDWEKKQELIKKKLSNILQVSTDRCFARKTVVKRINNVESREFLNTNHVYGYKPAKDVFGLYYQEKLVAVMSFSRGHLERFATSMSVVGGFSKLFSFAKNDMQFTSCVTYADLCWSSIDNNVYLTNGFVLDKINPPNYFWVKRFVKYSRQKFQKSKLRNFPNFADNKSESVIMKEAGYHKIYDAGHAKLIWSV